ncbi:acyl carrier protein [Flavobacterium weaverense]|uniref:Acyl carrier protein n=2 Tax=Flavobacterium weaverense TaxID=271156 RepID=A0A3L9ZSX8_9FLAO|nr:acyl carrier protein [Flavobacterium weaverense]
MKNQQIKMDKQQVIDQLKEIVKPYIQDQTAFDALTEDTDFISDLKINSANLVDVILDIEEKYNIEIDNDAMERMINVKAAMEIIASKLAEKN